MSAFWRFKSSIRQRNIRRWQSSAIDDEFTPLNDTERAQNLEMQVEKEGLVNTMGYSELPSFGGRVIDYTLFCSPRMVF